MTAQLDESVPVRLVKALAATGCRAVRFPNEWKGLKNGELLKQLVERGISCLITCDKNLRYQQTISGSGLALVILPRQRFDDLAPIIDRIADAVEGVASGEIVTLEADGTIARG